jgi:hypothetical protein
VIHPDIIQIAREEDLRAWRERERARLRSRQRRHDATKFICTMIGVVAIYLIFINWIL